MLDMIGKDAWDPRGHFGTWRREYALETINNRTLRANAEKAREQLRMDFFEDITNKRHDVEWRRENWNDKLSALRPNNPVRAVGYLADRVVRKIEVRYFEKRAIQYERLDDHVIKDAFSFDPKRPTRSYEHADIAQQEHSPEQAQEDGLIEYSPEYNPMGFFTERHFPKQPDPLDAIKDPKIRAQAEQRCKEIGDERERKADAMRIKANATCAAWEKRLDAMSERNPMRLVGEHLYGRLQKHQNLSLGRVRKRSRAESDMVIEKAIAADKAAQTLSPAHAEIDRPDHSQASSPDHAASFVSMHAPEQTMKDAYADRAARNKASRDKSPDRSLDR
jgi:hypothetical protein